MQGMSERRYAAHVGLSTAATKPAMPSAHARRTFRCMTAVMVLPPSLLPAERT